MSRPVIKLYPPKSRLSSISDEVIDNRKVPCLFFEFRETIQLNPGSFYQIVILSNREIKGQYEFQYYNSNLVEIKIFNESQLLSRTSKNSFTVKLMDQNNQIIGLGSFYRYRTSAGERSMNPANWDSKFSPTEHLNYNSIKYNNHIFSESPKSFMSHSYFPTPERSDSDMSLNSIESLKYSSKKIAISHSTPASSCVSTPINCFNFTQKRLFLDQKPKNLTVKNAHSNMTYFTDDSSDDDDYSFANRTNLTSHFDSQSQISLESKTYLDLFDSIESVSEIEFPTKKIENFHSFTILLSCNNSEPNYIKIKNNIFISNSDKTFVSNHAIRKLRELYNVRQVANFKVEINSTNANQFETDLKDLLIDGIQIEVNGEEKKFYFIGSSNSGMKERNFWAIDEKSFQNFDFESFLSNMGNFDQFYSIEKLNKRYSQFFSSSKSTIILEKNEFYVIKDEFSTANLCFTDGIGLIRFELCEKISKILALDFDCKIFQVRCGGFKGMLVGFPDKVFNSVLKANNLPLNNEIKVLFRKSQQKFCSNSLELNIVSWPSFDYSPVSLNSEFLMVLDGLSKTPELKNYLISLFQNYLDDLEDSLINPRKAFSKLFKSCETTEFSHKYKMILLACGKNMVDELDPRQYKIIKNLLIDQYLYNLITKKKFNVQIDKSRYLIGVLDETGYLNQDEVFVSYRDNSGKIQYLNEQFCIVARNPCYNLSEIRKVRTVFVPGLQHLENCIVFPKKGSRPLTNILSGGDLDGDFYFVSWDEVLTKIENSNELIDYPENQDFSTYRKIKNLRNQLAEFYAQQVINQNGIGLWHFYLTSLYDEDRNNMLEKEYIDAVIEINKCIDGIYSKNKKIKRVKKPFWYLTSKELSGLSGLSKEEKFYSLAEILNRQSIELDKVDQNNHRYSLLGCLATIAIKKYLSLISKLDNSMNGQFLTENEIQILVKNKKISLDICQESIRLENLKIIKQEYKKFISEIIELDNVIKKKTTRGEFKFFMGMYEKQTKNEAFSYKEQQRIELINNFRKFVVNLKYSENDLTDENFKNSVYCLDGYYFRSRLVSLYLDLKDEEVNYQIPWMFYDVLCYLKNYCNDNKSQKNFISLGDLTPFSIASEYINVFSNKKLTSF